MKKQVSNVVSEISVKPLTPLQLVSTITAYHTDTSSIVTQYQLDDSVKHSYRLLRPVDKCIGSQHGRGNKLAAASAAVGDEAIDK